MFQCKISFSPRVSRWMRDNEEIGGMEFAAGKTGRIPERKLAQTPIRPTRTPYGVKETQIGEPSQRWKERALSARPRGCP